MNAFTTAVPWLALAFVALLALVLLRRQIGVLLAVFARTGVGLAVLAGLSAIGGLAGITLGVNLANALVMGVLGLPGFGLLLMIHWVLQT